MNQNQDIGLIALDDFIAAMDFDVKWSIRQARSITWWGFDLAQTIWVDEPVEDSDISVAQIHAKTDIWKDVPDDPKVDFFVSGLNMQASLNGLIYEKKKPDSLFYDKNKSAVSLYCSAYIHDQNRSFVGTIFKLAAAIQAADALIKANMTTESIFGAHQMVRNSTGHPTSGMRDHFDNMTEVIKDFVRPHGDKESPFCEADFTALKNIDPNPSIMTNAGETGVTAEFPVMEHGLSSINVMMEDSTYSPGTALFEATNKEVHPQLGSGCLTKLTLPIGNNNEDVANSLNFLEMFSNNQTHFLGSWCKGPVGITYISFIPTAIYQPLLLNGLFHNYSAKAQWATNLLLQTSSE
tara:strand:+ start:1090 stop:2142 length:1053 start_codon:yes stop_codon:yes gene_type:complete